MTTPSSTTGASAKKGYKDLIIWQRSMDLAAHVYTLSQQFPAQEQSGLASQMRYASLNIATNIAIGSKAGGRKAFREYILSACSACTELETLTQIAHRLGYITDADLQKTRGMFIDLFGMLYKFAAALKKERVAKEAEAATA